MKRLLFASALCLSACADEAQSGRWLAWARAALSPPPSCGEETGWLCAHGAPLSFCAPPGPLADAVATPLTHAALSRCLRGAPLTVIADSVGRHALFDWLAEDVAGCTVGELDATTMSTCEALAHARNTRSNYAVRISSGGADVSVQHLADEESPALAIRGMRNDLAGSDMSDGGTTIVFIAASFVRNVTNAAWWSSTLTALSQTHGPLLLSFGLWNIKYDIVQSSVTIAPHVPSATRYEAELTELVSLLSAGGISKERIFWRSPTASDFRSDFPPNYTPDAVAKAATVADALWESKGYSTFPASRPLSMCIKDASVFHSASGMTTDGTHLPPVVNVALWRAMIAQLCAANSKIGGVHSIDPTARAVSTPLGTLPTPTVAPTPAATTPTSATPLDYAVAFFATFALVYFAHVFLWHRGPVEVFLRTPLGGGLIYAVVMTAVWVCDVAQLLPIVEKQRAVGYDSMLLFWGLATLVAMQTVVRPPPAPQSTPQPPMLLPPLSAPDGSSSAKEHMGTSSNQGASTGHSVNELRRLSRGNGHVVTSIMNTVPVSVEVLERGDNTVDSAAAALTPKINNSTVSSSTNAIDNGSDHGSGDSVAGDLRGERDCMLATPSVFASAPSSSAAAPIVREVAPEGSGFFPPHQTMEWKGWMMTFFLLYHYWDVKPAYNAIRVAVSAYLFLTGYGNYVSLLRKGPSLAKLCLSMLRINLFPLAVMAASGRGWVLYYIAPMHSLWTVVVYVFFAFAPTRPVVKLVALLTIIALVYETPAVVAPTLYTPLWPFLVHCGSLKEWVFRSRLDAYAAWGGMAFAAAVPRITQFLDGVGREEGGSTVEATAPSNAVMTSTAASGGVFAWLGLPSDAARRWRLIGIAFACALVLFVHAQLYAMPRFDYNGIHRFTSWIPIAAYLILRNLTPALRRVHLRLFSWLGEMSLEQYILQFHVWMAADAKRLVILLPHFRGLSFLLQTAVFLTLAHASSTATGPLLRRLEGWGNVPTYAAACALFASMALINQLPRECEISAGGGISSGA